jgi:hypothetical protein
MRYRTAAATAVAASIKLSTDPLFIQKVVDVVSRYHHPPAFRIGAVHVNRRRRPGLNWVCTFAYLHGSWSSSSSFVVF